MCMHTPHINDHVKAVDGKLTLRRNEQERGRLIEYMKEKKTQKCDHGYTGLFHFTL